MYLQQLYKQHKGWFLFVVLFIVGQLFINFKRGVVFSPFYHYGMYSEPMHGSDSVAISTITVNNKKLEPFSFAAQEWDKLVLPIYLDSLFRTHNRNFYSQDIERILRKISVNPKEQNYIMESPCDFIDWYKPYVSKTIREKVDSITINYYTGTLNDLKQKATKNR